MGTRGIHAAAAVLAWAIGLVFCAAPAGAEDLRGETIVTGGGHACAIGVSGRVLCWGNNFFGQLGRGTSGTPEPAPGLVDGIEDAVAISAGMFHTCAIREGGQAVCWGRNQSGQLGDGTTAQRLVPTPVSGLADALAISAGANYTCAIRASGQAVCWGLNDHGELGDGTTEQRLAPTAVSGLAEAEAISVGTNSSEGGHTCAIDSSSAEVLCWGANQFGQVGDGTEEERDVPTSASSLTATQVSVGGNHACAIDPSGQAYCWGANSSGQTGDEVNLGFPNLEPFAVPGLTETAQISAGGAHTCAVTSAGQPLCWGNNFFGQLGDGSEEQRLAPTPVQGLGESVWLSASPTDFTCATQPPGEGFCWGNNGSGQLGDGSTEGSLLPVAVLGFEGPEKPGPAPAAMLSGPTPLPVPGPSVIAPPLLGVRAVATPVSGKVFVRRPGSRGYVRLTEAGSIPIGSLLDTRAGRVRIVSDDGRGGTREADFYGGVFELRQAKSPGAPTEVRLAGPLLCPEAGKAKAKRASASKGRQSGRLVWGSGEGSHRSTGRFSSATVRGTVWLVWDRCDLSTLTRVARGRVSVLDFAKHKTVLVDQGHSYVAKPAPGR